MTTEKTWHLTDEELANLIAEAKRDGRTQGRREGAEEMRERAAGVALGCGGDDVRPPDTVPRFSFAQMICKDIRNLPTSPDEEQQT